MNLALRRGGEIKLAVLFVLMAFTLGGCSILSKGTPAALPTVVLGGDSAAPGATAPAAPAAGSTGGEVVASGIVAPAQEARLTFSLAGRIETLEVAAGDRVEAGQRLAKLAGSERLAAALEAARLEQLVAEQALRALSDDMDVRQAQAWEAYLQARETYSDTLEARDDLKSLAESPSANTARADLESALAAVRRLRAYYESLPGDPDTNPAKARALYALKLARLQADLAQQEVNEFGEEPDPADLEGAEADLALAGARLAQAKRAFEAILEGPDPEAVELAEARLSAARAGLAAAEAALKDLELRAPIQGTVTALNFYAGEWANPGQVALVLTDLQALRIETTDLSERDVPKVELGQRVAVSIKALGQEVPGRVTEISPLADTLGGDVVYKVTIELEQQPAGLRAGMSVEVRFE